MVRLALLLLLPLMASAASAEPWREELGRHVAGSFARPSLDRFDAAAGRQVDAIETLCGTPDEMALGDAREAFAQVLEAFGAVSVLRFGPLASDNRFERLFLWPDARGVTIRQVEALLADPDATVEDLAGRSVALQGLPALEFVLFGTGSEALIAPEGAARCRYGAAVAERIGAVAGELSEAWREGAPFVASFTAPGADTDPYRSKAEVAGEIVKAIGTATQFARDAEILPALGEGAGAANGRRLPFWRSQLSFVLVGAQIRGADELFDAAGFAEALSGEARSNANSIAFDLDNAAEALERIDRPPEQAVEDGEDWETLRYVTVALNNARRSLNEKLTADLGLRAGFNALDGD